MFPRLSRCIVTTMIVNLTLRGTETAMRKLWISAALALITTSSQASEVFRFAIHGGIARIGIPARCRGLSCLDLSFRDRNGKNFIRKDFKIGGSDEAEVTQQPVASPSITTDGPRGPGASAAPDPSADADATAYGPATIGARAPNGERRATQRQAADEPTAPGSFGGQARAVDAGAHSRESATIGAATPAPSVPTQVAKATSTGPGEWLIDDVARARASGSASEPNSTSPVGEWLIDDKTAKVRIEACGPNVCGYVSDTKNPSDTDRKNPDPALRSRPVVGVKVLLDMKPSAAGWDGNIYNAKDGSTYAAHIAMRNANTLRVEGCAFGGLLCGGQNWKRVD
jgi:uncharacterized protein (DUF2147 family)